MSRATPQLGRPLRWEDLYRESELYKAALRVFTKPLFHWRKALFTSSDGRTLYDLAARGLGSLETVHRALKREEFSFRPAVALHYRFNRKARTLYISPWEERIVDLLLYRVLNRRLQEWFSPNSYAYRARNYGLDRCQSRIAGILRGSPRPIYVVKRDITDYFASVNHEMLMQQLSELVEPHDYLFQLLEQRVRFAYREGDEIKIAGAGIPFGTAVACCLANVHLTKLDRCIEQWGVHYFRYGDDFLLLSHDRDAASRGRTELEGGVRALRLSLKSSHALDLVIGSGPELEFSAGSEIRHLGLQFRANGSVGLSRDKCRKIQNLFRYAFRRGRRRWNKLGNPQERAAALAAIARETIAESVRNVAIIDYYLKHVDDEMRLRLIDRWLAEEVLSLVFGGHRKGNFARLSFAELRGLGLPSFVHRRRLILNGRIASPFFVWQQEKAVRAFKGAVVRR